ncbi:MAG TPA: DUF6797 domain-containing protein, partial [Luteolibacter sp.]|nr:DUF6797 domain-containing protein [Luteolibacter sp.]
MALIRFPTNTATRAGALVLAMGLAGLMHPVHAAESMGILPLDAPSLPRDLRLHFELSGESSGRIHFGERYVLPFTRGRVHDVTLEEPLDGAPVHMVWKNGSLMRGNEDAPDLSLKIPREFPDAAVRMGGDFSMVIRFESAGDGVLWSKSAGNGTWADGAKALCIRDGKLEYRVAGRGELSGGKPVNDGLVHRAVLVVQQGLVRIWLDGALAAQKAGLSAADPAVATLQTGRAIQGVGGAMNRGFITRVEAWNRALAEREVAALFEADGNAVNTPEFSYVQRGDSIRPRIELDEAGVNVVSAWLQPLAAKDHSAIVRKWDGRSLKAGRVIYHSTCVVCHGTKELAGSLPTARRFATEAFKNGADPYSMYRTLTHGFGNMPPQPQYDDQQKYAVIQYIREEFLKDSNPSQYTAITPEYLTQLPKGRILKAAQSAGSDRPAYERMDFGPAMFWTYQLQKGEIAQKGIAVRLDEGPGGISKGKAWMIYDHDTMRMAAISTGSFIDWRGIAFDGSHGSHASLSGDRHAINPGGPGWASPQGSWDDPRPKGRDGKPYGPLPREWAAYEGLYLHQGKAILATRVCGTRVLESPGWIEAASPPLFVRTLNVGAATTPLRLRVAPAALRVELTGDGTLAQENGFWTATLPGGARTRLWITRDTAQPIADLAKAHVAPIELEPLTRGGPQRFAQILETQSEAGSELGPFAVDTYPLPLDNPWASWMRPGGFDFSPDGKAIVLATWNGDVWRVEGAMEPAPAKLRWQRIASGLFQPLGVKYRGEELFVTCRDQLARLRDLNGDHEIDFIECFNNDHQVTEHFHEFAMALQTDEAGNFYYAKSGRHARDAVVPQHGTVLRVSADGSRTDILCTGLRAANGMCVNGDGTFYVTDQEGYWTPKNRINLIVPGRFYGNMMGYTDVTDRSDDAMEPPVLWVDETMDRSPAELVKVPPRAWRELGGSLLNLSYGTGRIYVVPTETCDGHTQGAICMLPMPALSTGIMRGRFAGDGALYGCGMVGWASNAKSEGGFYRIRRTDKPAHLPLAVQAARQQLKIVFSDPLTAEGLTPEAMTFKTWSIRRTEYYGSRRYDERRLAIAGARLL